MTEPFLIRHGYNSFKNSLGLVGEALDTFDLIFCEELLRSMLAKNVEPALLNYLDEYEEDSLTLELSEEPAEYFQGDDAAPGPLTLHFYRRSPWVIQVQIAAGYDRWESWPELGALLHWWVEGKNVQFLGLEQEDFSTPSMNLWRASFRWVGPLLGMADLIDTGRDALVLAEAFDERSFSPDMILKIVRAGQASALVGLNESVFFDAKQALLLDSPLKRHETAKDVAAMANTEAGGIILVGASRKRTPRGDVVAKVGPINDAARLASKIELAVREHVIPQPDSMVVETAPLHGLPDSLVLVHVPPQDVALRPFIVAGAVIADKLQTAYISVPIRSGEDTTYMSPAAIHASLTVGRALLTGRLVTGPGIDVAQ